MVKKIVMTFKRMVFILCGLCLPLLISSCVSSGHVSSSLSDEEKSVILRAYDAINNKDGLANDILDIAEKQCAKYNRKLKKTSISIQHSDKEGYIQFAFEAECT